MKHVYGYVAKDGKIKSGSDNFTVVRNARGEYTVKFEPGTFSNIPAVSVAQIYYGKYSYEKGSGGNAVTTAINQYKVELITMFDKIPLDRDFSFIAVSDA